MKKSVSVIVPMYNNKKEIHFILDDLFAQTFENVEFIFVNDGSTDGTYELVQQYIDLKNDSRFRLFSQANAGVSIARNTGLEHAHGDYIIFVDSDDRVDKDFVYTYYSHIKKNNCDVNFFSIYKIANTSNKQVCEKIDYSTEINEVGIDVEKFISLLANKRAWGYVPSYISKRTLWNDSSFNPKVKYQEDLLALVEMLILNSKDKMKICISDSPKYYYVQRVESALHRMRSEDYLQFITVDNLLLQDAKKYNLSKSTMKNLNAIKAESLIQLVSRSLFQNDVQNYNVGRKLFIKTVFKGTYPAKLAVKRYLQMLLLLFNQKGLIKKLFAKNLK
jgi:glycosyltransferase involved in cell wall biosynthesis